MADPGKAVNRDSANIDRGNTGRRSDSDAISVAFPQLLDDEFK